MSEEEQGRQLYELAVNAKSNLQADRCTIYQVDRDKWEVVSLFALGLEGQESIRLQMSRGLVGAVARSGQSLNLKDAYNDPRFDRKTDQRTGYRTKSLLTVPIRNGRGQVIGVFQALNAVSGVFSDEDEARLQVYAQRAAEFLSSS